MTWVMVFHCVFVREVIGVIYVRDLTRFLSIIRWWRPIIKIIGPNGCVERAIILK